jgi:hypothetical protein
MFNGLQDAIQAVAPLTEGLARCRASVTVSGSAPWLTGVFRSAAISRSENLRDSI